MILGMHGVAASQGIRDSLFHIHEVRVTATPIFQKESAGMKETHVDSLVLTDKQNLSLSDLLSQNTSIFIKDHGRGALATASFRGTAASHTQVNWNGINLSSPMTGMVDFSLIPVYLIDDLSLKHGSASIADQSGGLGGSVNLSNKVNWNNQTRVKYMQGIGSYSTYDEFFQLALGNKKVQSRTRLYHNFSQNDYTYINRRIQNINPETGAVVNPLDTNDHADYAKYGLLQELYFRPANNSIFSVKWWTQRAHRTLPRATSYEGSDNANLNNSYDRSDNLVLDWNRYGTKSKWMIRAGYSGKYLEYTLKNNIPGKGWEAEIYSESWQHSFFNTASLRYNINERLSFESSLTADFHQVESRDSVLKTGYNKDRSDLSLLVALHQNLINNRLNINLMLRQEAYNQSTVPLIPYLGFDLRLFRNTDLLLKGNIARNFHQPSLNDLYWQPGGNTDLKAEEGISLETGLEYQKIWGDHKLNAELTAFRSDIDNWIVWIPSYKGYWQPLNIQRVVAQGFELSTRVNGFWGPVGYNLAVNYAYTQSTNRGDPLVWGDESVGKQLVYVPLHSGNILSNVTWHDFFVTWQFNAYSERFTTSSNDLSQRNRLYPYYMNDVSVGKKFHLKKGVLSTELKTYNLFNEIYHSALFRPMPRRNYHLLLTIQF